MTLVLDTHALVWYFENSPRLSTRVRKLIQDRATPLVLPGMAAAEMIYLSKRGKIPLTLDEFQNLLSSTPNLVVYPIDMQVIDQMPAGLDIHDALIVATTILLAKTRVGETALATADTAIIDSGLVKIFW